MIHLLLKNKQMKAKIAILVISLGIFLLNAFISLKEKDITAVEIESLGNGIALYHNISTDNTERFAILIPPLSGALTLFAILPDQSSAQLMTSGDYSDLISYMYALSIPMTLGESLVAPEIDLKLAMRWKNIVCMLLIFVVLCLKGEYILTSLLIVFFTIFENFVTSTSQVLCALFVICSAQLMSSLLSSRFLWKFILLGVLCSLTIASFGINGLILHGIGIASPIMTYDLQHKSLNRGFKKNWVIGFLLYFLVALFTAWITYGMYLEKFRTVAGMFGYKSSIELRIIPFYDSIKQTVFELIFKDKFNEYCIKYNLITLWSSLIVFLPILIYKFKSLKWQTIFPISLLIIAIFFNNNDHQKVRLFLETVSIIFPAAVVFAVAESRATKNA
jgi:hypothetical protein